MFASRLPLSVDIFCFLCACYVIAIWFKKHIALRPIASAMSKRAREAAEADLDELDLWCKEELTVDDGAAATRLQPCKTPPGSPPESVVVAKRNRGVHVAKHASKPLAVRVVPNSASRPKPTSAPLPKGSKARTSAPLPKWRPLPAAEEEDEEEEDEPAALQR
jgi:hypothetical protein